MAFLRNTPVEINETEVPIRITRYGMVPDSGGQDATAAAWAHAWSSRCTRPIRRSPRATATGPVRVLGVLGGKAGTVSRFLRNPGTAHEEDLGVHDFIQCQPGDVIRLEGCGGGATARPGSAIRPGCYDVRYGYVSVENARGRYGVVIEGGEVSRDATARLRAELAGARSGRRAL